jgi:hypothetical protein
MTDWKALIKEHALGLIVAALLVFGGRVWLMDHDARLRAESDVKAAQSKIESLQKQQNTVAQAAKVQVIQLKTEAAAVKTTEQAIAKLPDVEIVPLNATALLDAPEKAAVDAVPLYQTLNTCKQCSVNLDAATQELDLQKQITAEKDTEITALRKKPSFLHRLGRAAKIVGCAAGGAAAGSLAGSKGAAIGAAAGAGVCQMF